MDSIWRRENSHGSQLEESQEVGTELVVSSGDAPELFELVEEALDLIALAVERLGPTKALFASLGILAMAPRALRWVLTRSAS